MDDGYNFQKRSLSLHGHKTSVSLEKAFWTVLEDAAISQGISLIQLIKNIDEGRKGNLASALRVYALGFNKIAPNSSLREGL